MINKLRNFYCQKVLPLVYDDSLSYYECICKLTNKVNELIDTFNDVLQEKMVASVDKYFNQVMIDAVYNEDTETIILKKELMGDGIHVYSSENNSMTIE